jgi:hypothetical protein
MNSGIYSSPPQEIFPRPFDHHFRELVLPALVRLARREARGVASGLWPFSASLARLMHAALRRGAAGLSDLDDLEDYLASVLGDRALALQARMERQP